MNKLKRGWGLVETLLTLAVITALGGAVFITAKNATAAAKVKAESTNISELAHRIHNSFGIVGNYNNISTQRIVSELLAPESLRSNNALWSQWGSVNVASDPAGGFQIIYYNVPKESCIPLAAALSNDVSDIDINGTSIKPSKFFDMNVARSSCTEDNELIFIYNNDWVSGTYAADPLDLPPAPANVSPDNQNPETIIVDDAGDVADATDAPSTPPVSSGPAPTHSIPLPGAPTPSTPNPATPAPTSPTTPITVVSACSNGYEDRPGSCFVGQFGYSVERQLLMCELAGNPGVYETWVPQSERVPKGWNYLNAGSCSNCPSPATENRSQWIGYTAAMCAAGSYGYTNRELEQSSNRTVSYNCPAGTTVLPAPTYGGWSAWVDTGNNRSVNSGTCSNCPASSTGSQTQWVAASASCPASAPDGVNTWEKEQSSTRSISYNCPAGTASIPAATYGSWSAWIDTGNTRNVVYTCANAAPDWTAVVATCTVKTLGGPYAEEKTRVIGSSATINLKCDATCTTSGASVNNCETLYATSSLFKFGMTAPAGYTITFGGECAGTVGNECKITQPFTKTADKTIPVTITHTASGATKSGTIHAGYEPDGKSGGK